MEPANKIAKKLQILKVKSSLDEVKETIEKKKTSYFGSTFRRPSSEQVIVKPPELVYEEIVFISGSLRIDFNRKSSYKLKVPGDVVEVILGDSTFPIISGNKPWDKISKGSKDVEMEGEEHAIQIISDSIYLDHHGREIKFPYKLDSDKLESYPKKVLEKQDELRRIELDDEQIIEQLYNKLTEQIGSDITLNSQEFILTEFTSIYHPIFEARAIDHKNKQAVIQFDGVSGKLL